MTAYFFDPTPANCRPDYDKINLTGFKKSGLYKSFNPEIPSFKRMESLIILIYSFFLQEGSYRGIVYIGKNQNPEYKADYITR